MSAGARPPAELRPVLLPPARELIEALPPFDPIDLDRITLVTEAAHCMAVAAELLAHSHLGFDTESKPTFVRGEVSSGPHLVQFASAERAWLLPLVVPGTVEVVARVLAAAGVLKIGFGLDSDRTLLARRIGFAPSGLVDLDTHFRAMGYRNAIGLKSAVAVVLGRQFTKSKRIGTSNWSLARLSPPQVRYAANDAYGALKVYEALAARFGAAAPAVDQGRSPPATRSSRSE